MAKQPNTNEDPEIVAISQVYAALKDLDQDARSRVLNYVSGKFNITSPAKNNSTFKEESFSTVEPTYELPPNVADDEFEGISPVGRKWITRSGISQDKLMTIFSLGIDEIDLVSNTVPGGTKSQRMRNVFLLKGISSYLGTGAARFTHEQIKETCLHYNAWDGPNFANIFKTMSADVSGGKETGYTLTPKGMSEATALIKSMVGTESK
jgi:hypothetical protein